MLFFKEKSFFQKYNKYKYFMAFCGSELFKTEKCVVVSKWMPKSYNVAYATTNSVKNRNQSISEAHL